MLEHTLFSNLLSVNHGTTLPENTLQLGISGSRLGSFLGTVAQSEITR